MTSGKVERIDLNLLGAHIGHVVVMGIAGHGEICDMWVEPDRRGSGYGRELLNMALRWMRSQQCSDVVLHVETTSGPALHLYATAGFKVEATEFHMKLELSL